MKEIEEFLPTKLSRVVTIWTLPAATSGYFIVGSLRPLLSFWKDETVTILQVSVFLFLALIGALIIIASLIHHVKTRDIKVIINRGALTGENTAPVAAAENNVANEPSEVANSILTYCVTNDRTNIYSENVVNELQHSRIQIEAAFEELEQLGLLDISSYYADGIEYVLTGNGKKHVLNMAN